LQVHLSLIFGQRHQSVLALTKRHTAMKNGPLLCWSMMCRLAAGRHGCLLLQTSSHVAICRPSKRSCRNHRGHRLVAPTRSEPREKSAGRELFPGIDSEKIHYTEGSYLSMPVVDQPLSLTTSHMQYIKYLPCPSLQPAGLLLLGPQRSILETVELPCRETRPFAIHSATRGA
jgi:hypothetical protein